MELKHQVGRQIYNMKIKLKKLVKMYPNDMELGEAVRHIFWKHEKERKENNNKRRKD